MPVFSLSLLLLVMLLERVRSSWHLILGVILFCELTTDSRRTPYSTGV